MPDRGTDETRRDELGDRAANSEQVESQPWTAPSKIARDARAADQEKKGK